MQQERRGDADDGQRVPHLVVDPQRFVADLESFLPAASASAHQDPDHDLANPADSSAARAHILIVDDLPTNRELMRETLQPFGYRLYLADSVSGPIVTEQSATIIPLPSPQ